VCVVVVAVLMNDPSPAAICLGSSTLNLGV
jgi:hypothetical protein